MLAVKRDGDYYAVGFQGFIYAFRQDQTFLAKSPAISIDNGAGDLSLRGDGFLAFGQSSVGQSSGTLNTFNLPLIDQTDQRESRRLMNSSLKSSVVGRALLLPLASVSNLLSQPACHPRADAATIG